MKPEKLLDEIGRVDDGLISEAETEQVKLRSIKHTWPRWVSVVAACVAIVLLAVLVPRSIGNTPELPMLTIGEETGAFGFEGLLAYDISELQNGNPWTENDSITSLPVFQNPTTYDTTGYPVHGLSTDEMIQKAKDVATVMGLTIDSIYTNPTQEDLQKQAEKEQSVPGNEEYEPNSTPFEVVAICGDITIKVEANGAIRIFFELGVQLPSEYSFTYHDTSEQQAVEVIRYLLKQYSPIVDMQSPALALFGDYTFHGLRNFSYEAYENSGSLTDRILGFNFNRVRFSPNDDGVLWIIDRHTEDLSQKIGDYPIISAQEAQELLLQNHFITTVPESFPGAEYIASVELMYRTGRGNEVFMPYYRFLVELPSMQQDNGLKTFGAYYVPAVEGRYISNMPLWDGGFN